MIEKIVTDTIPPVYSHSTTKQYHLTTINVSRSISTSDASPSESPSVSVSEASASVVTTNLFTFRTTSPMSFSDIISAVGLSNFTLQDILELQSAMSIHDDEAIPTIRLFKQAQISAYDSSPDVNSFTFQSIPFWLDKDTRVGLVNSTNMLKSIGKEETTLWLGDFSVTLPCDTALAMLCQLEVYAIECYNTTALHKAEVSKLSTIQEILSYDITQGYPQYPSF